MSHTHSGVEIADILSHFFRKNFVKATVLLKKLLNSWFDEKKFSSSEREFLVFLHCVTVNFRNFQTTVKKMKENWFHEKRSFVCRQVCDKAKIASYIESDRNIV